MSYQRKTRDVFVIQTYTGPGYGWEDVHAEATRREAAARLTEYRTNQPGSAHRMVKRRERITPKEATT